MQVLAWSSSSPGLNCLEFDKKIILRNLTLQFRKDFHVQFQMDQVILLFFSSWFGKSFKMSGLRICIKKRRKKDHEGKSSTFSVIQTFFRSNFCLMPEKDIWWKFSIKKIWPLIEDYLWWKRTFDERWPLMEDNL